MGMYVCLDCQEKHALRESMGATNRAQCEICGNLRDDWREKDVIFTQNVDRPIMVTNAKQFILDELEDHARFIGSRG